MSVQQLIAGGDRNFAYIAACKTGNKAVLFDPSPDPERIDRYCVEKGLIPQFVVNTHSHFDHTGGNQYFKEKYGAEIVAFDSQDADISVQDEDTLELDCGDSTLAMTFYHTPGHTPDAICIQIGDNLITGDTLFVGKIGGTGSPDDARTQFESLKKLFRLPPATVVWPGHDYGVKQSSTLAEESQSNPFIQRMNNFDDFLWFKENWAQYKSDHKIK